MASDHLIDVDGLRKFPLAASATSKRGVETLNKRQIYRVFPGALKGSRWTIPLTLTTPRFNAS